MSMEGIRSFDGISTPANLSQFKMPNCFGKEHSITIDRSSATRAERIRISDKNFKEDFQPLNQSGRFFSVQRTIISDNFESTVSITECRFLGIMYKKVVAQRIETQEKSQLRLEVDGPFRRLSEQYSIERFVMEDGVKKEGRTIDHRWFNGIVCYSRQTKETFGESDKTIITHKGAGALDINKPGKIWYVDVMKDTFNGLSWKGLAKFFSILLIAALFAAAVEAGIIHLVKK